MSTVIEKFQCKQKRTEPETGGSYAGGLSDDIPLLRRWRSAPFNYPGYSLGQTSRNTRVHGQSVQGAYLCDDVGTQVDDQSGNSTNEVTVDESRDRVLHVSPESSSLVAENNQSSMHIRRNDSYGHQTSYWRSCLNRKVNTEWILVISNFLVEILIGVSVQLSSPHRPEFALISMLMSIVILLSCFYGIVVSRKKMVGWRWSYMITDIVGLACAIFQCATAAIAYGFYSQHSDNPIKVDFYPIIFSFGVLCSKFVKNSDDDPEANSSRNL